MFCFWPDTKYFGQNVHSPVDASVIGGMENIYHYQSISVILGSMIDILFLIFDTVLIHIFLGEL